MDGRHRVRALIYRGCDEVEAAFFEGSEVDAFVLAVRANVEHGLPLSSADRRAAATRILDSHPAWSDRTIAATAGLSARTIRGLRRASAAEQQSHRVGRDGRRRPVNPAAGRRRAADALANNPGASLRDVAETAGISPATVRDVRDRLKRGEDPVPSRRGHDTECGPAIRTGVPNGSLDVAQTLDRLAKDPSLRMTQRGRELVRWLRLHEAAPGEFGRLSEAIPPYARTVIRDLAMAYSAAWESFAAELKS
ncbi:hypothetical protein ACFXG4_20490 [Nocardia sp. NPDC059246]|uniref:hypothetical protein n=1 Tax=unclassified Nocardia TaxID=2637762 RepID=UPI0036AA4311